MKGIHRHLENGGAFFSGGSLWLFFEIAVRDFIVLPGFGDLKIVVRPVTLNIELADSAV